MTPRRAVAVVVRDGRLLVMKRRRGTEQYAVLPGGGVEVGETSAQAAVRELAEECTLVGTVERLLMVVEGDPRRADYFEISVPDGEPVLGGIEAVLAGPSNVYEPCWVHPEEFAAIGLRPDGIGEQVMTALSARPEQQVVAVNLGLAEDAPWTGRDDDRTAIVKAPVTTRVLARRRGLVGDEVADTVHHGGLDMAVYAFAAEDLARWGHELGGALTPGAFGENRTTQGIEVNAALVGERWRVGEALLEISKVRIPCYKFQAHLGRMGFDSTGWVKRFTQDGQPGPYLRVLEEGSIAAGDPISVVHRPAHGITVTDMFRALTTERGRLPELLRIEGLAASVRATIEG